MKKYICSILPVVLIVLLLTACSCEHEWASATCTSPATCTICGELSGEALGHTWTEATCTAPKTCSVCNIAEGSALEHNWADATCTTPKTCATCNTTDGNAAGHSWADATCTVPKTCNTCNATEGVAAGHTWQDATCVAPKTCSLCSATEGEVADHNWNKGACAVCGYTPEVLVEKVWTEASGKTLAIGDEFTFYVEAYFKHDSGPLIFWFVSCDNPNSIASADSCEKTADNTYAVTLTVTGDMYPGKWVANWFFISDQYGTSSSRDFTEEERNSVWFNVAGSVSDDAGPDVSVEKIWTEESGKALAIGDEITFYVEAYFKHDPGSLVLWFVSCDNPNSIASAVSSEKTADNTYAVTLTVSDNMYPGKWVANWFFISDKYGTSSTRDFTEEERNSIWFVVQ